VARQIVTTFNADGVVYLPYADITASGIAASNNYQCTKVVTHTFDTNGNVNLNFADDQRLQQRRPQAVGRGAVASDAVKNRRVGNRARMSAWAKSLSRGCPRG